jgi:hypothetical protein
MVLVAVVLVVLIDDGSDHSRKRVSVEELTTQAVGDSSTPATSPSVQTLSTTASSATTAPVATEPPISPTITTNAGPLVIAAPSHVETYDRDFFGSGWVDADGDCQDTRAEALVSESRSPVTFTSASNCTVATGDWIDPWSGIVNTTARALDVDHTVPLANAWRSGAWAWTTEQRVAFANELDFSDHLIGIPLGENRSKGDAGPETWRPPDRTAWCHYATAWIAIKVRWHLTATSSESTALDEMTATC